MLSLPHAVFAVLLVTAGAVDLRARRVPNVLVIALALGGAAASFTGPAAPPLHLSIASGLLVFAIAVPAWRLRLCGGGDAKLAAAAALWVGTARLVPFFVVTALAGGVLSGAYYAASWIRAYRARAEVVSGGPGGPLPLEATPARQIFVPYGVAIAIGALYAVLGSTA